MSGNLQKATQTALSGNSEKLQFCDYCKDQPRDNRSCPNGQVATNLGKCHRAYSVVICRQLYSADRRHVPLAIGGQQTPISHFADTA